jgi:hypothetical protein
LDKEKYHELLNDATVSRISEFGYSNEAEVIEHYHKTKKYLRNRPLKVPTEQIKNKFDIGANKFTPSQIPNPQLNSGLNNNMLLSNIKLENRNSELNALIKSLSLTVNQNENERKFVLETKF